MTNLGLQGGECATNADCYTRTFADNECLPFSPCYTISSTPDNPIDEAAICAASSTNLDVNCTYNPLDSLCEPSMPVWQTSPPARLPALRDLWCSKMAWAV